MAPLDYKYAEWPGRVYHNLKMQSVVYGLLIEEAFGRPVRRGWLCYLRSKHRVAEVEHGGADKEEARATLSEVLGVIRGEAYPEATKWKARCRDCCYRNVCLR
jgi:CRISPR-associated exonuclease Cas4